MSVILICVNILVLRYNLCLQLFTGGIPLNGFDIYPKPLGETHKLNFFWDYTLSETYVAVIL